MTHERRDSYLAPELRESEDGPTTVTGYAALFDVESKDLGGFRERIKPGAFKRVLSGKTNVLALFNHDMNMLLGSRSAGTLRVHEDTKGLKYDFDLDPSDPDHQRVIAKIRRGDVRGSSFAFKSNPTKDEWSTNKSDYPLRSVGEVAALRDVGPVAIPAYEQTAAEGKAVALRSLAEKVDVPVDDLVEATDLRDFLLRKSEEEDQTTTISYSGNGSASTSHIVLDSADAAAAPDAAADERVTPTPLPEPPKWYDRYKGDDTE